MDKHTFIAKQNQYKSLISDAYLRMASNMDEAYRQAQLQKVNEWLQELTNLYQQYPELWIKYS